MHYDTFDTPNCGWVEMGSESPSTKKACYFVVCNYVRSTQRILKNTSNKRGY